MQSSMTIYRIGSCIKLSKVRYSAWSNELLSSEARLGWAGVFPGLAFELLALQGMRGMIGFTDCFFR